MERELAQDGEVVGAVADAHPAGLLAEDDIEHPVEAVLPLPVLADRPAQDRRIRRQGGQVVARPARAPCPGSGRCPARPAATGPGSPGAGRQTRPRPCGAAWADYS